MQQMVRLGKAQHKKKLDRQEPPRSLSPIQKKGKTPRRRSMDSQEMLTERYEKLNNIYF